MPQSSAQKVTAIEHQARVLEYRKLGLSFEKIAETMLDPDTGERVYADKTGAWKAYQSAIRRTVTGPATEERDLDLLRIDELWRVWYPRAMGVDPLTQQMVAPDVRALRECGKLLVRRARMLGYDAPTSHRLIVTDAMQAEIERLAAELGVSLDDPELTENESEVEHA